jgi:hypothetical protein
MDAEAGRGTQAVLVKLVGGVVGTRRGNKVTDASADLIRERGHSRFESGPAKFSAGPIEGRGSAT